MEKAHLTEAKLEEVKNCPNDLGEQILDHFWMVHPGEALVEAKVAVGKALMIDTEGLEHGSIEIINMHRGFPKYCRSNRR